MHYKRSKQTGFSLIELLVIISIISLLSSIALAMVKGALAKAQDARILHDRNSIAIAMSMYHDDTGQWPPPLSSEPVESITYCLGPSSEQCAYNPDDGLYLLRGDDDLVNALSSYLNPLPRPEIPALKAVGSNVYTYGAVRWDELPDWKIFNLGGVYLVWPQQTTMTEEKCPSPSVFNQGLYGLWYCYQWIGSW